MSLRRFDGVVGLWVVGVFYMTGTWDREKEILQRDARDLYIVRKLGEGKCKTSFQYDDDCQLWNPGCQSFDDLLSAR